VAHQLDLWVDILDILNHDREVLQD
jgi:hypothetical protein